MRPHENESTNDRQKMQINEDSGEDPGVSSRQEIPSSSGGG